MIYSKGSDEFMEQRKFNFNSWEEFHKYREFEIRKIQKLYENAAEAQKDFDEWCFKVSINLIHKGIKKRKNEKKF